jgi:superfamily II DNA or RNA helicase
VQRLSASTEKVLAHGSMQLAEVPSTSWLIDHGYLAQYRVFAPTIPDLRKIKMRAGDYAVEDLETRMGDPVLIGDVIQHYKEKSGGRALAFCVSVKASKDLVRRANLEGIPAAHVDGETRDDERDARVADLAAGRIKLLSNVMISSEGLDIAAIDCMILLRPTAFNDIDGDL